MQPSTRDPDAVQFEVQSAYAAIYSQADPSFVPRVFGWARAFFGGGYGGYQAVDTQYHDFEHTMQGVLCMSRLLLGRHRANASPRLSRPVFELGITAMLLHDSGYLKEEGDNQGTGAKYTATHVDRSAQFASEFLAEKGLTGDEITAVQCMIRCTGINADVGKIPFRDEEERIGGYALVTADYLGQMAADDYVEKLPVLYEEFAEAKSFSTENAPLFAGFASANDLLRKTPDFWKKVVRPKLENDFLALYKFLNDPYPDGPNEYILRIEANMERARASA